MPQQISVALLTTGALTIPAGVVADPAGNLWNLPANFNVPSGGKAIAVATADAQNANAPFPGSDVPLTIETAVVGWTSAKTAPTLTYEEFISTFSEFSNVTNYPIARINFWLEVGYKLFLECVWLDMLDEAVALYVAHNIVLEFQNTAAANNGAAPGQQVGAVASKSVSKVSLSYDVAAATMEGFGDLNLTNYGTRLARLINIFGAQGIRQIGAAGYPFPGLVVFPFPT